MKGSRHAALLVAFVGGVGLACADRLADDNDDLETEELLPACMAVFGTGEWDDGTVQKFRREQGGTPSVCWCTTEEEFWYLLLEDEQAFLDHEINARALAECNRMSAMWEFDSDPCQEYYETGAWRPTLQLDLDPHDDDSAWNWEGLTCGDGEGEDVGCAIGPRPLAPIWLLALAGVVALRRRRSTST